MSAAVINNRRSLQRRPGAVRVLSAVAAVVTVGVFPVFLVGGLGVQLQRELDFGAALLGVATAGFFGVAALASRSMGWVVERIGSRLAMRLGAAGSAACLFGMPPCSTRAGSSRCCGLPGCPTRSRNPRRTCWSPKVFRLPGAAWASA